MGETRYVIIGNSAAAVGAVEAIRKRDTHGAVTLISDEARHTYSRPLISYKLLGKVDARGMLYRDDQFYARHGAELLSGTAVTGIDAAGKTVTTSDGRTIPYDKLLVATGSAPFVPPVEGLTSVSKRFTFMKWDDADALEAALTAESRVLIVGAGLIGLKCAEGVVGRVQSVTVCDLAERVLSSVLDQDAAARVQRKLEQNGIELKLGASVKAFRTNPFHDGAGEAELTSGEKVAFDILVMAVGVRPNVGLVKDAGGAVGRGVTIDDHMRTTLADVYAAGDCTESADAATGDVKIMALLPNAYMQGECAGANMAGGDVAFDKAIPMNAVGFFGLHMLTAGSYTGDVYEEADGDNFKRLFYGDNKLNGFILIGNVEKGGVYTKLVREKTPLDSIDFDLIRKKPGLMAFSRDYRNKELGGRTV